MELEFEVHAWEMALYRFGHAILRVGRLIQSCVLLLVVFDSESEIIFVEEELL